MDAYAASFLNRASLLLKFWFETSEMTGFDQLEVWRSTLTEGGPYKELTGAAWSSAYIEVETSSKEVSGKSLELLAGTHAITITFSGVDPLSVSTMATQINAQALGLVVASSDSSPDRLRLTTADAGCGSRLEVTGGDAASILGFELNVPSYGTDARVRLGSTNAYTFEDPWHEEGYYYKTRLRRALDGVTGEFSVPLVGNPTRAVTPDQLVRGFVRMVDLQGRPVGNRSVLISTKDTVHNSYINGFLVDMADQVLVTDSEGYASVLVLRGVKVTVGIAGTALVRDVTPPTDPTVDSFNLFDPSVSSDDAFSVQVPDINLGPRIACP